MARASASARWVLAAMLIACILPLGAMFNYAFSQARDLPIGLVTPSQTEPKQQAQLSSPKVGVWDSASEVTKVFETEMFKEWADSTSVTIPLLGVRISVADVDVLGSAALATFSFLLFVALKREAGTIIDTVRAAKRDGTDEIKSLIRETILSTQVYSVAGRDVLPRSAFARGALWQQRATNAVTRVIATYLVFLPFVTIVVVTIFDVCTVTFTKDLFRPGASHPHVNWWTIGDVSWLEFLARTVGTFIVFGGLSLFFALGAWRLQRETRILALSNDPFSLLD
jgi:hypothetical protein